MKHKVTAREKVLLAMYRSCDEPQRREIDARLFEGMRNAEQFRRQMKTLDLGTLAAAVIERFALARDQALGGVTPPVTVADRRRWPRYHRNDVSGIRTRSPLSDG
jgi:hypothetical protein